MMRYLLAAVLALATTVPATTYEDEVRQWRADRHTKLMRDGGWLTLTGLFWLQDGVNDVTLPTHPPSKAKFILKNGRVTLNNEVLRDDTDPKGATVVKNGSVSYEIIKREDNGASKYAIRVKDTDSEARRTFKGLDYFPINPAYRVMAHFEPYNPPRKIMITNVLGMTSEETAPGALVFNLMGKTYRIDPIWDMSDPEPRNLFIIFRDKTSGKETYGAARYMYANRPDEQGNTVVDFNKSYNPPCVFTHFATCPLPPPQNRLPIRIEAGEKKYAGHV